VPRVGAGAADAILDLHMGAHAHKVTRARDALLAGDPDMARTNLQWLAEHTPPVGLPIDGAPYLTQMQQIAREAAIASRPDGVAEGLGRLAVSCGNCHAALNAMLDLEPSVPTDPSSPHAESHGLAIEQLWLSLVTGTPDLWRQGLNTLGASGPGEAFGSEIPEAARRYATAVHAAAAGGMSTPDPSKRGAAYGKALAACAACHEAASSD
jgi:cytochrome c553